MIAADDDLIDDFYEQFEETLIKTARKDITLVIGDWDMKIGTVNSQKEIMENSSLDLQKREEGV